MKSNFSKKVCAILCAVSILFLSACGAQDQAEASGRKTKISTPKLPPLKKSFVLREGTKSNFTAMAVDKKGDVYAAGVSDNNCVIFKLDKKLKTIKEMVKFGSPNSHGDDIIKDITLDSHQNVFVTGYTRSVDFPVTQGCYHSSSHYLKYQAFVTKFSSDLKLMASTLIGGELNDKAHTIAIDGKDNIYVAGFSEGGDPGYYSYFIPPAGAYDNQPAPDNQSKAFVAKLSNDLSTLKAATHLGGNLKRYESDDEVYDIGIDGDGNIFVAGQTNSPDFPVTKGCVLSDYSGKGDVFVAKLNPELSKLLAATYLGGMNQELATAMVLDKKGDVFVGGWTESPDFPMVKGGYDTQYSHEEEDAFIVKLNNKLTKLKAATYLGGNYDASGYGDDLLSSMALSSNGKMLCVTGRTESENFPVTPKCYKNYTNDSDTVFGQEHHRNYRKPRESSSGDNDYGDGFISLFDTDLSECRYSTYFGGDNLEYMDDILFDGKDVLVAGITYSYEFPRITTKEREPWSRGFVIRFNWKKNR